MDAALKADQMAHPWYGNWGSAAFAVALFSIFVLSFLRSPLRREWRHLGLAEAYLVALFAEMFGVPLTIYLLVSVLGAQLGLGMLQGHLWAVLLDRLGLLPLAPGWVQTWRAKGALVTSGLYRLARHPQYLGFLFVIVAFLIQWPTLPTLVLFPVLVVAYVRLARREERDLAARFGARWDDYQSRVPLLLPLSLHRHGPGDSPRHRTVSGERAT